MVERRGDIEDMNKRAMKSQERTFSGKKSTVKQMRKGHVWKTGRKYPKYIVIYVWKYHLESPFFDTHTN